MKKIYILIGPKGSGKTYIANILKKKLGIHFLVIEDIFKKYQSENITSETNRVNAYKDVEAEVHSWLEQNDIILFESTGLAKEFWQLVARLKTQYQVNLISITAPKQLCLERVRQRDAAAHISIPEEIIKQINQQCRNLKYESQLQINTTEIKEEHIVRLFRPILINE